MQGINYLIPMGLEIDDTLIQKCLLLIEKELGWGEVKDWSTRDFEALSNRIMEKTHIQLSVVTLKRVWGRIRYDSSPTVTTLNTLAQYVGFENWRAFRQLNAVSKATVIDDLPLAEPAIEEWSVKVPATVKRKTFAVFAVVGLLFAAAGVVLYFTSFDTAKPHIDPSRFSFSSKKVVDVGVPNTVIFDYDATAAKAPDSVFIQQTWDKRLSKMVSRDQRQHTSIYYHPGFFQAKLRINDQVVRQHELFIKSNGWLPLVDLSPVPVYYKTSDVMNDGYMSLPVEKIKVNNIALQPTPPWVGYYNVGDFEDIMSNDFIFETEFKNDYNDGAAACQHSEVHVLFQGATMVVPFSIPGCVSELNFGDMSGKKLDLSPLGVDFSKWVNVKVSVQDSLVHLFINGKKAFDLKVDLRPLRFAGMIYRFQGSGSVNFIRISKHNGDVTYDENFDLKE
jgi:hypothetical protein